MIRSVPKPMSHPSRLPRMRGDDPASDLNLDDSTMFAPHARG